MSNPTNIAAFPIPEFKEDGIVVLGGDVCVMKPEIGLRFVERDGKKVLQQRWQASHTDRNGYSYVRYEWRDVPLEVESAK